MSDAPNSVPCPTCTAGITSNGFVVHQASCVTTQNQKHKDALHKIADILKDIGIGVAEAGGEVLAAASDKE